MTDTQRALLLLVIAGAVNIALLVWVLIVLNTVLTLMSDYRNILRDIQKATALVLRD